MISRSHQLAMLAGMTTLFCSSFLNATAQTTAGYGGVIATDEWRSGAPIPAGTDDRRGPLAPGVTFWPHGFAHLSGDELPDMFMGTDRFSHPSGVFLYEAIGRDQQSGAPVFSNPKKVNTPFNGESGVAVVIEDDNRAVTGVWHEKGKLNFSPYDQKALSFGKPTLSIPTKELPREPQSIQITQIGDTGDRWMAVFAVGDGKPRRPTDYNWRMPEYRPYDGSGIYRGNLIEYTFYGMTFNGAGDTEWLGKISPGERATLMTCDAIAEVRLREGGKGDLVAGTMLGGIYYFPAEVGGNGVPSYEKRLEAVDRKGNALRFPSVHAYVSAYPNEETGFTDLLVGTQGLTQYYRFSGEFTAGGKPIFEEPNTVMVENATLQLGALTVPNVVDWDGDGTMDIVAGNSDGLVVFCRNVGTDRNPRILPGVPIEADGHPIHVQPGYHDIQGPYEARWGYSCPTVVDWDGDGDPDIVMSDPTAAHTVFINEASAGEPPVLARGSHLYWESLDLFGTWRVRPAAAQMGDEMAYVILDGDNELHLYWRLDDYNVESRGKILQPNGKPISGAYLSAGGQGRLKLLLHDWDGDGLVDIVTGTSRHASVGNPDAGLPQALGRPGSSVLWLRNVGTNSEPVLEWPRVMAYKGEPIFFGQHSCAPAIANIGPGDKENMIVGTEDGKIHFFERDDIEFLDLKQFAEANGGVMIESIHANPDEVSDKVGEWVRLKNTTGEAVNLHGWWLNNRGGKQVLRGKDGKLLLAPGATLTLGRSKDQSKNGGVKVDLVLEKGIALSNERGVLGLYSDRGVRDAVRWGENSEELLHSEVTQQDLIHGMVPELCRDLGGAIKSGDTRTGGGS